MKNAQHDNRSKNSTGSRARRSQVTRACNWCRLNRIKCDDNQPCRNCEARGGECTSDGRGELRSLPQATREIERLKTQVKSLEMQLEAKRESQERHNCHPSTARSTPAALSDSLFEKRGSVHNGQRAWASPLAPTNRRLYGPSSPFYYLDKFSSFYGVELNYHDGDTRLEAPDAANDAFACLATKGVDDQDLATIPMDSSCNAEPLSRSQENYFLGLFWESHFSNLPILDEGEFREHYKSLWVDVPHGQQRKPSPLVDIVIALCMQYGMTFMPRVSSKPDAGVKVDQDDSSVAGRGFFRRCQSLLAYEMEKPSINTLQCHLLSALYLRNASFTTREHITIAVAARLAYLLGMHRNPATHLPPKEQELRKRLFWCLYIAENQIRMNTDHPIFVSASIQSCGIPSTSPETASETWSNSVTVVNGITFLQYQAECAKLVTVVRSVDMAFKDKCNSTLAVSDGQNSCSDTPGLEELAKFLSSRLKSLREWVEQCPSGIKTPRRGGGRSFSTDRSPLEIDPLAPLWLQRQCVLLELLYHDQAMCLYAPFLRFSQAPNSSTTLTDRMALYCLQHAMATTNIVYQVLTETDVLNGWHEAYKYTWNAAMSILGYIFGYPVNPSTQSAWRALSTVVEIFDIFGNNFAIAAKAAIVVRDLIVKAKNFTEGFRPTNAPSPKNISNMPTPVLGHSKPGSVSSVSSVSSDVGNSTPTRMQPPANALSVNSLPVSMFDPSSGSMTSTEFREGSMDMDMNMVQPCLTNHGLSANDFAFQFSTDPFCDFDMTYDQSNGAGENIWPDLIEPIPNLVQRLYFE